MKTLDDENRDSRRSIADVYAVIERNFGKVSTPAEIKVGLLTAGKSFVGAAIVVTFPELDRAVLLPSAKRFTAMRGTSRALHSWHIRELNAARCLDETFVQLASDLVLRAVEVIPCVVRETPREGPIVREVVRWLNAGSAWRDLWEGLEEDQRVGLPAIGGVDYAKLFELRLHAGPLPAIQAQLASRGIDASRPTIAEALRRAAIGFGTN